MLSTIVQNAEKGKSHETYRQNIQSASWRGLNSSPALHIKDISYRVARCSPHIGVSDHSFGNKTPKFAYVVNEGSGNVSAYTIDGTTGALSPITGSPFAAESAPLGVAVDPSGKFAYVTNQSHNVSAYTIDGTTGALSPITGSPFAAGGSPFFVAIAGQSTVLSCTVQPPINPDGSSVFNSNRGVVPVKFTLTSEGAPTCDLPQATISLIRTSGTSPGPVNESSYTMSADTDSNFRISGCQYVYNLGSGSLGSGTYQVQINISGAVVGSAMFGLR